MKKLIPTFLLLILIIPTLVFAGGGSDDIPDGASQILECEYALTPKRSNVDIYYRFKAILYKDSGGNYYIEKYNYYNSQYNLITSGNLHYFDVYDSDNKFLHQAQITVDVSADSMAKYYNDLGNCPYAQHYDHDTITQILSFTDTKALNGQIEYSIVEANNVDIKDETGTTVTPYVPKVTNECKYNISENQIPNVEALNINFYMTDNAKKYMEISIVENGESYKAETEVTFSTGGALFLDRMNGYYYTVSIDPEDVEKVFLQNDRQAIDSTFSCPSNLELGVIEESYSQGMYRITTDMQELQEWGGNHAAVVNPGNISYEYKDMIIPPIQPDDLDCESLLGSTTCTSGKNCEPAFYLQIVFTVMKYVAIVILIVMSMMDFLGAVGSSDDNAMKKAFNKCIIRLIICVIIFVMPTILEYLFTWMKVYTPSTCGIK